MNFETLKFPIVKMFCPLDDRYTQVLEPLKEYTGEQSLMKYRLKTEIDYFIWMAKSKISTEVKTFLKELVENFSYDHLVEIKEIEKKTKHDVKAVEYFLRKQLEPFQLDSKVMELIHCGLTSQDINTSPIAFQMANLLKIVFQQQLQIIEILKELATENQHTIMMARTHGQPAIPTTLGKELMVFVNRLIYQTKTLQNHKGIATKFGGAVGNLNAHVLLDPEKDWEKEFDDLIVESSQGLLTRISSTTQILPYDYWNWIFNYLKDFHLVIKDLCQDIWLYVSLNYFHQEIDPDQVGSSAMPQKINPIDFENCEGNSDLVEMWCSFLPRKLTVSRWQRDLTDSTVLRNVGQPFGYSYLALKSLEKGLLKLKVNHGSIHNDLEKHPTILAEAFQVLLRKEGCPNPYEVIRKITQGQELTLEELKNQILASYPDLKEETINKIKNLDFKDYVGKV